MKLKVYWHWQSLAIAFVTDFDISDTLSVVFIAYCFNSQKILVNGCRFNAVMINILITVKCAQSPPSSRANLT